MSPDFAITQDVRKEAQILATKFAAETHRARAKLKLQSKREQQTGTLHDGMDAQRRAEYYKKNKSVCERIAAAQAKANPSDPFTYARVLSHFMNGIPSSFEDYSVEFRKETSIIEAPISKKPMEVTREIAINHKVMVP